jgi:hypothetical protein
MTPFLWFLTIQNISLSVLQPALTLVDIANATLTARQEPSQSTTFGRCTFSGCQATGELPDFYGGAVYVEDGTVSLGFAECRFESCGSSESGGAVYAAYCCAFSMNETSGFNCSAVQGFAFFYAFVASTVSNRLNIQDASAVSCTCTHMVLFLACDFGSAGNTTTVDYLNSSLNRVSSWASGICAESHYVLSLHFSTFWRNTAGNCLYFPEKIVNNNISCLTVVNNSCVSERWHPGLLYAKVVLTFSDTVFQLNSFDYFLGTDVDAPNAGAYPEVAFINCVFSDETLSGTNPISFWQTRCTIAAELTSVPECLGDGPQTPPPATWEASPVLTEDTRPPTSSPGQIRTETPTAAFTAALDVAGRRHRFIWLDLFTFAIAQC